MKIGILGGTFDPVHNGHLALAKAALKQAQLDRVVFMLTPTSPFKLKKQLSPVVHRLAMLKKAVRSTKHFRVGTDELSLKGPSFTVNTLRMCKKKYPKDEFFLIMGSDAWVSFPRWKQPRRIMQLARVIVGKRPGNISAVPLSYRGEAAMILKGVFPVHSSTQLREELKNHKWNHILKPLVPYIKRHHLYGYY